MVQSTCVALSNVKSESSKITYYGLELNDDSNVIPEVKVYRSLLLDFLLNEFNSYFPDTDLKNFAVFDPNNMTMANDYASCRMYGINKIKELGKFFKIGDPEKVVDKWVLLLESVIISPNYCLIKNDQTRTFAFWSQLLKWSEIKWGTEIRRLVYTVLSIPISSAEAEGGFLPPQNTPTTIRRNFFLRW